MTDLSFSEFALLTEEDVKNLALACKVSEVSCLSRPPYSHARGHSACLRAFRSTD